MYNLQRKKKKKKNGPSAERETNALIMIYLQYFNYLLSEIGDIAERTDEQRRT